MFHFIARPKHIFGLSDLELIFGPVHIYMNIIDAFWTLNDPYLFNNTIVLETRSTVTTEKCILNYFTYNCYLPSEESTMVSLAPLLSNTSQSLTVLSHEPLARRALLELKLSELTGPSCPASTCYQMPVHV